MSRELLTQTDKNNSFNNIAISSLANGLTVAYDHMPEVKSVAYSLLIPGGICLDNEARIGESLILSDLFSKGAGSRSVRELSDAYEFHGINSSENAGSTSFGFTGTCISEKLLDALDLLSDIVLRPHLPSEYIDPVRSILLQDIESLQESPSRWAMTELSAIYYNPPFNRPMIGSKDGLNVVTRESIQALYDKNIKPGNAILSIAGNFDKKIVHQKIESVFSSWHGSSERISSYDNTFDPQQKFIESDTNQTQIVFCFPSANIIDPLYYATKLYHDILSGGMYGRLFDEVRKKRGLCYHVSARHTGTQLHGSTLVYAGTTTDRAQETFTVIKDVFKSMRSDVSIEELDRAKANVKSSILLADDSTRARASSNGGDLWMLGRVRSTEEIKEHLDSVSISDISTVAETYHPNEITSVILGKKNIIV
jgi:predicted Zn-dependent peptidase